MARSVALARVFIALWPAERTRAALVDTSRAWRWSHDARPTPDANLHLTLHFIGDVPAASLEVLADAIAIPHAPFRFALARAGVWRNGIAALEPEPASPPLQALHAALGARLERCGLAPEARPFRPHVTLARDAARSRPGTLVVPIEWMVSDYALVRSSGGRYRIIARHRCDLVATERREQ